MRTKTVIAWILGIIIGVPGSAKPQGLVSHQHQVIVVQGSAIPGLLDSPVEDFRLYRYETARAVWSPLPFQIDAFNAAGSLLPEGNDRLKAHDEIVFMAQDMGDQAPEKAWQIPGLLSATRHQLQFQDPGTGELGWVYALSAPELVKSDVAYIQVDEVNDQVSTPLFHLVHGESGFLESAFLKQSAGGDSIDFIDRQKLRLKAKADFGFFGSKTFTLKEQMDEDIKFTFTTMRFQSYKSGVHYQNTPVIRAFREMLLHVKVHIPGGDNYDVDLPFRTVYYPAYFELMMDKYQVPDLSFSGIDAKIKEVRLSLDLNENAKGLAFYNPHNTDWNIVVDGKKDSPDKTHAWPGNNWYMFHAQPDDADAMMNTASIVSLTMHDPPELGSSQKLYYKDDDDRKSSDTGDKVSYGDTGVLIEAGNLAKDTLAYYQATYLLPENLSADAGESLFNQHVNPPELQVETQYYTHWLTVLADPSAGGTVNAAPETGALADQTPVTLEALPNPGYVFKHWSTSESDTALVKTFLLTQDTTITAFFQPLQGITIATQPAGLFVTVDDSTVQTPVNYTWLPGDTHRICVNRIQSPAEHTTYLFQGWDTGADYCDTFVMPDSDTLITALFQTQHELQVTANAFGQVRISPTSIAGYYDENTWVKLQAVPDQLYDFLYWEGDLQSTLPVDSVFMDSARVVHAVFGNRPPVVMMPDTAFAEDDTLFLAADTLQGFVQDSPSETPCSIRIENGRFVSAARDTITGNHYLTNTLPHWNGLDSLIVTVTDPLGVSVQDTFLVHVLPQPDAPSTFALLAPETNTIFSEFPDSVWFSWEKAVDVDLNDTLTYIFELDTTASFNSSQYRQVADIQETLFAFPWPQSYGDKIYYWRVSVTDKTFVVASESSHFVMALFTDVAEAGMIPRHFMLDQNYPNPFNGTTEIRYGLPRQARVRITVYDNLGREVTVLADKIQEAGYHTIQWHGLNRQHQAVASGIYFIVLSTADKRLVKKAMYVR